MSAESRAAEPGASQPAPPLRGSWVATAVVPAGVTALVATALSAEGAYFPTSWGWLGILLGWLVAVAALVRRELALSRLEWATLALLTAFVGWAAISLAWSKDVPQTVLELERDLVYPLGLAALLLLARRTPRSHLLAALGAAITGVCIYALATRLFPGRFGLYDPRESISAYRLNEPLGYWNTLGILAVVGILIALGLAADRRSIAVRAAAAVSLLVLPPTLYYTFSRGAWIALSVALVVAVAISPRRLWFATSTLALAPWPAIAVLVGSRLKGLTTQSASVTHAADDGRQLAILIAALAVPAAATGVALELVERRIRVAPTVRRAWAGALIVLLAAGLTAIFVRYGSPPSLVRDAYNSFSRQSRAMKPTESLEVRLFNFSSKGRAEAWHAAWANYTSHPVAGSGAGSFEQYWYRSRPREEGKIRDAHSLYMEVLTELGPPGLGLLVAALAVPLVAALAVRRERLVPAAAGAYSAYVVHAGVDWDWEMVGLTLIALGIGGTLLIAWGGRRGTEPLGLPSRGALLAGGLTCSAFAALGLVGNYPLARSHDALGGQRWRAAAVQAHRAIRWQPWAGAPWQALGLAQRGQRDYHAARQSLVTATERDPSEWSTWFDLGTVTTGREQRRAYTQAARLNPHGPDIVELCRRKVLPRNLCASAAGS